MQTLTLISPESITATGGGIDVDVSGLRGKCHANLISLNTAGSSPTLAIKLQESEGLTRGATYNTEGATENELREGATTKVKLAAKFTQSGARSVKRVALMLKKAGTIAAGKKLTLTLETNNAGVPSGTVVQNGTAATVDIDTEVGTSYAWVVFTFAKPVDVADATVYHLALAGDYDVSAANNVLWRSATVASGGNQSTHDNTNWTAVATQSHEFYADEYTFSDVTTSTNCVSGVYTTVTDTVVGNQTKEFNADNFKPILRGYRTVGGSSNPAFATGMALHGQRVQEA